MLKKLLLGFASLLLFLVLAGFGLWHFKVLWVLAPYYEVQDMSPIPVPIMDMKAYEQIWDTHRRPYIFKVQANNGGEVCILGVEHSKDPSNTQFDSIRFHWDSFDPDVALVEGRVGNLITWFQDPIVELGEGGLITSLANADGVALYSWEPHPRWESEVMKQDFTNDELVMFYSFRPYFSNMRHGKPSNPEDQLQDYLDSRSKRMGLEGTFTSWQELDKKWNEDFPEIEWRDYSSGVGYPDGYMHDIWNRSNMLRDEHMLQVVNELVKEGKKVIVVMGVSHAPRIEESLKALIG